jgi:hypothetical protein
MRPARSEATGGTPLFAGPPLRRAQQLPRERVSTKFWDDVQPFDVADSSAASAGRCGWKVPGWPQVARHTRQKSLPGASANGNGKSGARSALPDLAGPLASGPRLPEERRHLPDQTISRAATLPPELQARLAQEQAGAIGGIARLPSRTPGHIVIATDAMGRLFGAGGEGAKLAVENLVVAFLHSRGPRPRSNQRSGGGQVERTHEHLQTCTRAGVRPPRQRKRSGLGSGERS